MVNRANNKTDQTLISAMYIPIMTGIKPASVKWKKTNAMRRLVLNGVFQLMLPSGQPPLRAIPADSTGRAIVYNSGWL